MNSNGTHMSCSKGPCMGASHPIMLPASFLPESKDSVPHLFCYIFLQDLWRIFGTSVICSSALFLIMLSPQGFAHDRTQHFSSRCPALYMWLGEFTNSGAGGLLLSPVWLTLSISKRQASCCSRNSTDTNKSFVIGLHFFL